MKTLLIILLFPLGAIAQLPKQYLVTKSNDTLFYKGDLVVNDERIFKWKTIKADEQEFVIRDIQCAFFNNNFYYNCDGRRLYKRIASGETNVYAMDAGELAANDEVNLKFVFIQFGEGTKPKKYAR